jgi:hypothetical protein
MLLAGEGLISVDRPSWAADAEIVAFSIALIGIAVMVLAMFVGRRRTVRVAGALTFVALTILVPLAATYAFHRPDDRVIPLDDKGFYKADCRSPLVEHPRPSGALDIRDPAEACRMAGQARVETSRRLASGAVGLCVTAGVLLAIERPRPHS